MAPKIQLSVVIVFQKFLPPSSSEEGLVRLQILTLECTVTPLWKASKHVYICSGGYFGHSNKKKNACLIIRDIG